MSTPASPPPAKKRRSQRRYLFIPLVLLLCDIGAMKWRTARGTWADRIERNPYAVSDGPISQLYQEGDTKFVRCAIVLPYSVEHVWSVVTDYQHYSDFLPYVKGVTATQTGDVWKMKGLAEIPL